MSSCEDVVQHLGLEYRYEHLCHTEEVSPDLPKLIDFLGYGSEELKGNRREDTYASIRREALKCGLSPMSLRKALSWSKVRLIVTKKLPNVCQDRTP